MTTGSERGTITLLDENSPGTVTLIDKDRDTFCMSVVQVISSVRLASEVRDVVQQVADLRDVLAAWIEKRKNSIHSAYLSFRSDGILFVVMQTGIERDENLATALAELDTQVAQDDRFDLLSVDTLSIPRSSKDAASAFLSSGHVQHYAGQD
jgi:hypothetical protein